MKTLRTTMMAILALVAVSCNIDDVEDRPVVANGTVPVLTAPEEGNVYVLTETGADALAERFIWTAGEFGQGIIASYDVEIDNEGGTFETPIVLGTTSGATQLAVTASILNNAVTDLGATPETPGTYLVRVKAYVGTMVMYSEPVEILITSYQGSVPLSSLYIVGDATEFGFNNNAVNTPLFRDAENQFLYHFTGYLLAGDLKFLSNLGAWQPQYGANGEGVLAVNDGTGSDPAPIVVATAGYYTLTVNTQSMTYTIVPFDASAVPVFNSVGIIGAGSPGGWDADTVLTNTTGNTHIWHKSGVVMTTDEIKFRANAAWDLPGNWGGGTPISGQVVSNGGNFVGVAEAGTYDVWFNDIDGRYIFIPAN
jgi:hypothetical protein